MSRAPRKPALAGGLGIETLAVFACILLIGGYVVLLAMAAGRGVWLVAPGGVPAQADFNGLWAAGRLTHLGRPGDAYSWPALEGVIAQAGRAPRVDVRFPFYYPPIYLVWLKPLGALTYAKAAVVWLTITLAAYVVALRGVSGRLLPLLAGLAAPAVLACFYAGQNGLLTAALAGAALAVLPTRPAAAGVLIGLLAYKPQFGVVLPVLLIAGGRWRTFAWAAGTVVATYALAGALLGWDVYARCLAQLAPTDGGLPAIGGLPVQKLQSLFGLARTAGVSSTPAWAIQALCALAATGFTAHFWRSDASWAVTAAAAVAAMLIVSPYSVLYDFPLLSVGIAFLIQDGERAPLSRGQCAGLIAAFAAPFVGAALALPLCPIGAVVLLAVALSRQERGITKVSPTAQHPNGDAVAS